MCGAFHEGRATEEDQAWVFQSSHWQTHLCARVSLAAGAGGGANRQSHLGPYALVDHARRAEKPKTDGDSLLRPLLLVLACVTPVGMQAAAAQLL